MSTEIKRDISKIAIGEPIRFIISVYEPYNPRVQISYFHEQSAYLMKDIKYATLYESPGMAQKFIDWLKNNSSYSECVTFSIIPVKVTFIELEGNIPERRDDGAALNCGVYFPRGKKEATA